MSPPSLEVVEDDLDAVYPHPQRRRLLCWFAVAGALLLTLGVAGGRLGATWSQSLALVLGGVVLLAVAVLCTVPPATAPPPALQGAGGVLLPVRRVIAHAGWALVVAGAPILLLLAPIGEPTTRREAQWPLAAAGVVALALWVAWRLVRSDLRLRLDPSGVHVPSFWRDRVEHVAWDRVGDVVAQRAARPALLIVHAGHADAPTYTTVDLRVPAWRASLIAEVLTHYAQTPEARAELTDPRALDRFRGHREGRP